MSPVRGAVGGSYVAVTLAVLAAFAPSPARGQAEPGGAPVGQPGLRIVAGQSAVIGGNGAGARERALDEAFRLAVDQALAEMLDAPTRAAQAKAIKGLEARARSYVRRYRALDEGEAGGIYTVHLEVEIDEAALRRAAERWGQGGPGAPAVAAPVPGLLLVSSGAPEAPALLLAALVALGARAQAADPAVTDTPAAVQAASSAKLPQVAFVGAQAQPEGTVRGTTKIAMSCRLSARVFAVPSGLPVAEHAAAPRAFADDEEAARRQCLTRAAGDLAARLAPGAGSQPPGGAELRAVTIDADIVEPAAVVALLKNVRSVGAVSSAELRRIVPGHVEIRARTRAAATALAPALARDVSTVVVTNVEVTGDIIHLRARLRPPVSPPTPAPNP